MRFFATERTRWSPGAIASAYVHVVQVLRGISAVVIGWRHCLTIFAEAHATFRGTPILQVTRAVHQHEATCMVGTKAQWEYLLKHGDAAEKREDPNKNWFESLKWIAVFMGGMCTHSLASAFTNCPVAPLPAASMSADVGDQLIFVAMQGEERGN